MRRNSTSLQNCEIVFTSAAALQPDLWSLHSVIRMLDAGGSRHSQCLTYSLIRCRVDQCAPSKITRDPSCFHDGCQSNNSKLVSIIQTINRGHCPPKLNTRRFCTLKSH
ncbi:hypothetical protein EGW08_015623 [Elysia chlorotica]|uniref:Uncharacterized protein n=1 Tax=Elysia chlorotica TaxID=188477 RepID=A0A3S1B5L6_ELYCH|nr:hypothetical protein EGW08_015623 [Elysia chlorotica]